jgi:hypothetical protein
MACYPEILLPQKTYPILENEQHIVSDPVLNEQGTENGKHIWRINH